MDALESGERADRRAVNAGMCEIKLDDFITWGGTGVRDAHRRGDGGASGNLIRSDFRVGVTERRKAQAVAEGIKRLLGEVAISAAVHAVAAEGRDLGNGFVKSDRQSASRVVIAGKNVGHGRAAFFTGIPGFKDCPGMLLSPVHGDGAAGGENDDERLSRGREGFKKLLLRMGKIEVETVAAKKAGIAVFGFFAFKLSG